MIGGSLAVDYYRALVSWKSAGNIRLWKRKSMKLESASNIAGQGMEGLNRGTPFFIAVPILIKLQWLTGRSSVPVFNSPVYVYRLYYTKWVQDLGDNGRWVKAAWLLKYDCRDGVSNDGLATASCNVWCNLENNLKVLPFSIHCILSGAAVWYA